jgi:hypothetical protein
VRNYLSLIFSGGAANRSAYFALLVLPLVFLFATTFIIADSHAQGVDIRKIDTDARGDVYELRIDWSLTLGQTLDSLGSDRLDMRTVGALTRGWFNASEILDLPALSAPQLQIISVDHESRALAASLGEEETWVLDELAKSAVRIDGLGMSRRVPTATLVFQPVTYDAESGVLRRYSRIRVRVTPPPAQRQTPGMALGVSSDRASVSQSVLADGVVFKFPVLEEGIYRIDYEMMQQVLSTANMSVGDVRMSEIRIFGNGGQPLPALAGAPRPIDLVENPIEVIGGANDRFNQGDAVVFYAKGPSGWRYRGVDGWEHYVNPYSTANYYFLKIGGTGRRVSAAAAPSGSAVQSYQQVTGRIFEQRDELMWGKSGGSGKTWLSRRIEASGELRVFDNRAVPDMAPGTMQVSAHVAIRSNPRTAVLFFDGGNQIGRILASRFISDGTLVPSAASSTGSFTVPATEGRLNVSMRIENPSGAPSAALDWMRVLYPQRLRASNGMLRFATPGGESGVLEFRMGGFSGTPRVWDVTEIGAVRALTVEAAGDERRVRTDVIDPHRPREIIAFTDQAIRTLRTSIAGWNGTVERVQTQNLHGLAQHPEFVIVAPGEFRAAADRLADHRRAQGMDVLVVDVQKVYNEFSGGVPDMRAVRDFFKFVYDRSPGSEPRFRYALLFGDGHYNFRDIAENGAAPNLKNWILPYQTRDSFDPIRSYTSDDYFGLLDDNEGIWDYPGEYSSAPPGGIVERMDIGVGRLTVQTSREADVVVDKILSYESAQNHGQWRSLYTFLADDHLTGLTGTTQEQDLHTQNADAVAQLVESQYPRVNVKKIYAESYQREFINGWRIPEARRDLLNTLNDGTLILNFSGHGNTESLMQEQVFTRADVARLNNADRLSIFITATCDFGRWDMPDRQSGAEDLLLHEGGGSVALLTTVRLVFTSGDIFSLNVGLNRELTRHLLQPAADGSAMRLGDAMRLTKNTQAGLQGNNRKFNLLGDPTMRIGLPSSEVVVERVNDVEVSESEAPLRALEKVVLQGSVRNDFGLHDASFSGLVDISVFDAERRVPLVERRYMSVPYYTVREDLIWRGTATAENGQFEATFVVPKDISYRNELGRISTYAYSADGHALGYTENVRVGGTAPNPTVDVAGPDIRLFLNDTTFVAGGIVSADPTLIVKLFDESGINTVGSGVGHEMLLTFNDDAGNAVDLSRYYQAEAGSYQRGKVEYRVDRPLTPGRNTLSVRAWDVANNSSTETIDFYVAESEALTLRNIFNYPNPTSGRTRFVFEHNQPPGTPARVQVRVYTLNGRAIRTINADEALPAGVLTSNVVQIPWDGLDDDLGTLATGVYLYRLRVEVDGSDGDSQVSEHIDRIALIR